MTGTERREFIINHIKNSKTEESVLMDDLYNKEDIFGANS
jgi:hypothetical protein